MPLRPFLGIPFRIFPRLVGSETEGGNSNPTARVPKLGIFAEVADQNDFVDAP
jgi:hypothetical protein